MADSKDRQTAGDALDRAQSKLSGLGHILNGLFCAGEDGIIGLDDSQLQGISSAFNAIIGSIREDLDAAQKSL